MTKTPGKTRSFSFRIGYPGCVVSVNHYRGRRRDGGEFVKPEAREWMTEIGWLIKTQHIEDWRLPLHVTCSGTFQDRRSAPDLSNLSKCLLDALQEVSGVNDRDMRWHDGTRAIDISQEPSLKITIEESSPA